MNLSEKKRLVKLWDGLVSESQKMFDVNDFGASHLLSWMKGELEQKFPFLKSKEDRESVK